MIKFIKKKIKKKFFIEVWSVGIFLGTVEDFIHKGISSRKVIWLKSPGPLSFYADPFIINEKNTNYYIFAEQMTYLNKIGKLVCFQMDKNFNIQSKKTVFTHKHHTSFPFIFKHNDKKILLFESFKQNNLLYCEEVLFPFKWGNKKVMIPNVHGIDPVLYFCEKQNKFFVFFSQKVDKDQFNLYLGVSNSLDGLWSVSEKPIVCGGFESRMAGAIIKIDDNIYRPAQDASSGYGSGIILNKITNLSIDDYKEEGIYHIGPTKNNKGKIVGIHTINSSRDIVVFDVKRHKFIPYKIVINVMRRIFKMFLKFTSDS